MPTKIQQLEDHLLQWLDDRPIPPSGGSEQGQLERATAMQELAKLMAEEYRWKHDQLGGISTARGGEEWNALLGRLRTALIEKFSSPR